ncbi:RagB/SusD family nutrient uptake outer membrane protein [Tamlana sp. 2201CG12-4]|uniref:RagB/SusD family nutrient uptake outer membrane protein n=1 Tax=Tamlana sp. 2201CG12-4 TaxID=3112582 RepID=UPI002DBF441E|nr:RagB/SusD family nutrient uptake outer membrane protein [Tamlana sp. 2201CG12-4]MEC3907034.1 RagB/SusD family nutrient uptake outer membrane protein [Tamlana sp. 2201CG12-4]
MKFINKLFLVIVAFGLIFQSCADLEEDLSSVITIDNLSSERDIVTALTPIYRQLLQAHRNPHFLRTPTYGADDITTWEAGNKAPLRVFDRFDYGSGENSDINWLNHGWDNYWRTIYFTNSLIEGLKTSTASTDAIVLGDAEARFFRALCYFNLVRTHGNMPIIADGIEITGGETRATVLENYLQMEADLLIAEANLPAPGATANVGRVSSAAAKALLADLYLTWGGWPVKDNSKYQMAANKAKEVIDMGYFTLLPIDQLWLLENQNSTESIFAVQFSKDEDLRSNYTTAFSFHEARGFSDAFPELQFFNDFPEGPRKDATFATEIPQRGVSGGVIFVKDPPTKPWPDSQRQHPMYQKFTAAADLTVGPRVFDFRARELYRYAEVLLIYAEAQARVGQTDSSIEAFNQVKRRAAGLDYLTPNGSVDVASASVDEIIAEKGWELAGEYKRWFDLVRTEKVEEIAALRDPSENVLPVRMPTKAQYIAPIPFQAISTSNLEQNPEGFKIQ